ncbi:MAG: class I SAM-dependent methyltransferase [Spirochaetia bacterium]|jgi:ubiquinone/menaquinone biosynthesis C-methylase UbiE|nr:class I SAM-dependent methyltransferase [Spirochaetia bacterium]
MINTSFYNIFMIPFEKFAGLDKCRKTLIPLAYGNVLEAGPGTGANAKYYNWDAVSKLTLVSPDPDNQGLPGDTYRRDCVSYVEADVQSLPFDDNTFDTVVATLLFCSVADPDKGLSELRRVLKPGGKYIFLEHVKPSKSAAANFTVLVTPYWKKIAGGCHLDRDTGSSITRAGFKVITPCLYSKGVFIGGAAE